MKTSGRIDLLSLRGIVVASAAGVFAGCPQPSPLPDASPDVAQDRVDVPDPQDVPSMDVADVPDSAADTGVDASSPIDPACIPLRPTVGSGTGPGADQCGSFRAPEPGTGATWCSLGTDVPGLRAPTGFCIRRFATMGLPRVMAFAPNGDLFVASPSAPTAAGDSGGMGAIVVLSDDNRDGTAEMHTFATGGLNTVHGIVFSSGFVYFTTEDGVYRSPYAMGQRAETAGSRQTVAGGPMTTLGSTFQRGGRWTHGLAASVNGRVLATRGEYSSCMIGPDGRPAPGIGEVYEVGMGALNRVASGFRNPMYARCHPCRDVCMVAELGEDQTTGAVETLVAISNNNWFGYPCCYQNTTGPRASSGLCRCIDQQQVKINLGDTPFGFDWERGAWPEPYRNGVFVALHGSFYLANYAGAGVVFLQTDPATGLPRPGTPTRFIEATNGTATPSLLRPSDVLFSRDGRLFLSDDKGRGVYWVAPTDWRM